MTKPPPLIKYTRGIIAIRNNYFYNYVKQNQNHTNLENGFSYFPETNYVKSNICSNKFTVTSRLSLLL